MSGAHRVETVLINGRIHTADPAVPIVEAVAISRARIAAVGTTAEIRRLAGRDTEVRDLGGRVVVPGLVDTHAHLDREGLRRAWPTLQGCRSIEDVKDAVRREAARRRSDEWIVIGPLGDPPFHIEQAGALREGRYPDRADLDAAAPGRLVWIRAPWGYWSNRPPFVHVLSSAALRACGIDRNTTSPSPTVEIERDGAGEPTGRILERYYTTVAELGLLRATPRIAPADRRAALREAVRVGLAAGTTATFEGHGVDEELLAAYRDARRDGELPIRVTLLLSPPPWRSMAEAEGLAARVARERTAGSGPEVVGVYLGHGGNPHTTAAISASWPYTGWAGMRDQCNDDDEYRELCRVMARHGIRVCTVVGGALAGSETLDRVLSAWDEVDREHPIRDMRWVLAHVARLDPQRDIPRVLRLGAVVTTQPASYLYRDGADALERGLDDVWMPFRTWTEAGIPWALSTDNKPYRMLFTLRTALARREMHGRVVGASQRLTFDQAIRAASASGAYVRGDDADTGALTPGRLADLVVLPVRDEADVGDADADLTMIGGEFLHPPRPR